jgi:hypothetical protein
MSRPTAKEYARAIDLGGQARRAGHKEDRNPYRHGLDRKGPAAGGGVAGGA